MRAASSSSALLGDTGGMFRGCGPLARASFRACRNPCPRPSPRLPSLVILPVSGSVTSENPERKLLATRPPGNWSIRFWRVNVLACAASAFLSEAASARDSATPGPRSKPREPLPASVEKVTQVFNLTEGEKFLISTLLLLNNGTIVFCFGSEQEKTKKRVATTYTTLLKQILSEYTYAAIIATA